MWLQFTRWTHFQIPFISYPKRSSNIRLMRRIKNTEIYLVQIATSPILKYNYRSFRTFLNSTPTRNKFESFQTQATHKNRFQTMYLAFLDQNHTNPYYYTKIDTYPYGTQQVPYNPKHVSIYVIFFFLFFFFLSLISSLSHKDQNEIFILVLSLFISLSSQMRKLSPSFL